MEITHSRGGDNDAWHKRGIITRFILDNAHLGKGDLVVILLHRIMGCMPDMQGAARAGRDKGIHTEEGIDAINRQHKGHYVVYFDLSWAPWLRSSYIALKGGFLP